MQSAPTPAKTALYSKRPAYCSHALRQRFPQLLSRLYACILAAYGRVLSGLGRPIWQCGQRPCYPGTGPFPTGNLLVCSLAAMRMPDAGSYVPQGALCGGAAKGHAVQVQVLAPLLLHMLNWELTGAQRLLRAAQATAAPLQAHHHHRLVLRAPHAGHPVACMQQALNNPAGCALEMLLPKFCLTVVCRQISIQLLLKGPFGAPLPYENKAQRKMYASRHGKPEKWSR